MTSVSELSPPKLSIVTAVYFEEECIPEFISQVRQNLEKEGLSYEIVFVDDGSRDRTADVIEQHASIDSRIKLVQLSRNKGKEVALTAGIEHARGDCIMFMDPDLQDPPEAMGTFVRKLDEGYDLVFGVREQRADTFLNALFSKLFWLVLNNLTGLDIPKNLAVMRVFNRKFSEAFLRYPERIRFIEGVFMHIGMRRAVITIPHRPRFAGHSKFNMTRKMRLAFNAILAFSDRPLKMTVVLGLAMCVLSGGYAFHAAIQKLVFDIGLSGWTSMIVAIVFFGGIQTIILGIVGLYVGRIYTEVKARPLYVVLRKLNVQ
jgi:glycosyltransferase involved in cell wall biosynthesis